MPKNNTYQEILSNTTDWIPYLKQHSNLPGPRGNLELAQAAATLGRIDFFESCLAWDAEKAPENTPESYLYFCGTLGLGKWICEGHREAFTRLQTISNDPRWRTREAVAMALQTIGRQHPAYLTEALQPWVNGSAYEQRAVVAGLCEPDLVKNPIIQKSIFPVLNTITQTLKSNLDPKSDAYKALKKGLGYGWSVAVAYAPENGKPAFEKLAQDPHPQVRWVVKENLKKNRLKRLDEAWVRRLSENL